MQSHPLADLFPLMQGAEFDAFAADIKARGLLRPVIVHEDMILDGRNRHRACKQAGIAPRFERYTGTDPLGFILSSNLHRRHLNESQRAQIADKLATMKQGARTDLAHLCAVSQEQAATMLNVSRRTVQHAAKVRKHGIPELVEAVARGVIPVKAAANIATQARERQLGRIQREQQKAAGAGRQPEDYYRTPAAPVEWLLAVEQFGPHIWECCCGDGAIARVLEANGYKVTSTDLYDQGYGKGGVDFLETTKLLAPDLVINPPFDQDDAFALHALDLGARKLALFGRVAWLEGTERYRLLWSRGKLARVWVFTPRLTLWRGDDEYAQSDGGTTAYAWFVFERDHKGPSQQDWLPGGKSSR
jgi:hypothetical protein